MPKNAKNHPAHTVRLGACRVTIWANSGKSSGKGGGRIFFSLVPSRSFRNDQNEWDETSSLGAVDVPVMQTLLSRALDWVLAHQEDERSD